MQTRAQQPEPERQQVTKAVMMSQPAASVSTCSCVYSRITMATALKSLWSSSLLCAFSFVLIYKNSKKAHTRVLISIGICVGLWGCSLIFILLTTNYVTINYKFLSCDACCDWGLMLRWQTDAAIQKMLVGNCWLTPTETQKEPNKVAMDLGFRWAGRMLNRVRTIHLLHGDDVERL